MIGKRTSHSTRRGDAKRGKSASKAGGKPTGKSSRKQARKHADHAHRRRMLGRVAIVLVVVMALAVVWRMVSFVTHAFRLRQVEVYASYRHISRDEVQKIVAGFVRSGFLSVSVYDIQHALQAKLPWAAQVTVTKTWPDKLQITLREQQPVARWNQNQFFNAAGERMPRGVTDSGAHLPALIGPPGYAPFVFEVYEQLRPLFSAQHLTISQLSMIPDVGWILILKSGERLTLGRQEVNQRARRFLTLYPRIKQRGGKKLLAADLRYSNGLAARYH